MAHRLAVRWSRISAHFNGAEGSIASSPNCDTSTPWSDSSSPLCCRSSVESRGGVWPARLDWQQRRLWRTPLPWPSMHCRLLQKEKESSCGDPGDHEKGASSYGQHQQRAEIVIARLSTKGALFFHVSQSMSLEVHRQSVNVREKLEVLSA
jgi:hypothetical protein